MLTIKYKIHTGTPIVFFRSYCDILLVYHLKMFLQIFRKKVVISDSILSIHCF